MSRWSGRHETCEHCGLKYENFKTGFTFKEVRRLLWVGDPDYTKWKYKRRNTVLGLWHQIKKGLWGEHLRWCEMIALAKLEAKEREWLPEEAAELAHILSDEEVAIDDIPF